MTGDHRLSDPPPWILDDPFALVLVGPAWREVLQARRSAFGAEFAHSQTRAGLALRSRYAEDRLVAAEYRQYAILGAGRQ